ncbi:MAG: hypothetical protein CL685_02860 [Candidatus Magasanikbacteria bacterium]|nr:hypothetical protein [Candidatus Magasanikbacteria bacterium]
MLKNFESNLVRIDKLLSEGEESPDFEALFSGIDSMCDEIDQGVESRKDEVETWSLERKRKEAVDSQDTFVLNLLSMDEEFTIRTLSACNPNTPNTSLRRLVEGANDYVRMVIANNPRVSPDVLSRIAELSGEQEVLDAVKNNPNVSKVTKFRIENKL